MQFSKVSDIVETHTVAVLMGLAVLFALAALLRLPTPAAFIGMLFGCIVMWRYGQNPPRPLEPEDAA